MKSIQRPLLSDGSNAMDVARPRHRFSSKRLWWISLVFFLCTFSVWAAIWLYNFKSSVAVDRETLIIDTARLGTLTLSVQAQGTFATQDVRVVSALQAGIVDRLAVKPGAVVKPGTIIAVMQSSTLLANALDARASLRAATANLEEARVEARAAVITQQTIENDTNASGEQASLQATSLGPLHRQGYVSDFTYRNAKIESQKLTNDLQSARAQVDVAKAAAKAKIAAAQAKLDQARAQVAADDSQVEALNIRSTSEGTVQSIDVDAGATVDKGAQIARIADTHNLKAVIRVAESDVGSVAVGMRVNMNGGDGQLVGRVSRIAPTADNGTVSVDVSLPQTPRYARPAQNIDATVDVATIRNVVIIARPAGAANHTSMAVFKLAKSGTRAVRTNIFVGRGSSDRVEILNGLRAGDVVIVSDMSAFLDKSDLEIR